jgi:hypothetical protein
MQPADRETPPPQRVSRTRAGTKGRVAWRERKEFKKMQQEQADADAAVQLIANDSDLEDGEGRT